MTDGELENLLQISNSDRTERKESLADGDKIRQAICALPRPADHRKPGSSSLGRQSRQSGRIGETDQSLLVLSSMRSTETSFSAAMTVQKRTLKDAMSR